MAAAELVGRLQLWTMRIISTRSECRRRRTEAGGADGKQDNAERDEERTRCSREPVPETFDRSKASEDLLCTGHQAA